MKTCGLFKYNLLVTFLMCISTIIKLYFLYTYAIPHSNAILAYARAAALLLFCYILLNYILFGKAFIPRLIVHELLGLIILADIIYFSYFNSLPTLADLQKINLLFAIRSVTAIFKLHYLLFFADAFILITLHVSMKHKPGPSIPTGKVLISIAALLAILLLIDTFSSSEVISDQTYKRLGFIAGPAGTHLTKSLEGVKETDAEFASQLSLYPSSPGSAYSIYVDRYLYGLPQILKDNGYSTMAIHGFKPEFWNRSVMYPVLDFDKFINENDFKQDDVIGMGVSDMSFFTQSIQYLKNAKQPFYAFLVTLSSHHPYIIPKKYNNIELQRELQNTLLGSYLPTIQYKKLYKHFLCIVFSSG